MTIVLRSTKGSALTIAEMDGNFTDIDERLNLVEGSTVASVNGETGSVVLTTSNIAEGTNLYFSDARFDARVAQTELKDFLNVDAADPEVNDVLAWDGSAWVAGAAHAATAITVTAAAQPNITSVGALTALSFSGSPVVSGAGNPVSAQDLATKAYVDGVATGLNILEASQAATAAALPTVTFAAGTLGVGDTLTANSNGAITVDGYSAVVNDRILVKDQVDATQNGIYKVTTVGSGGTPFVLTRATDFDQAAEMKTGSLTYVQHGTANAGSSYALTTPTPITVNTTSLSFVQFSGSQTISAGDGLTLVGSTLSVSTGGVTNAMLAGSIAASKLVSTDITQVGTLTSLSVSGQITSSVTTGTAPFVVASTTRVLNLNAATAGTATTAGTVTTAAQPNITSVGTLTALTTSGQITSTLATGTSPLVVASTTLVANLAAETAQTVTTAAQPNITSVGTLTSLTVAAAINGNILGSATTASTVTTAAQPNITSVGTLTSLTSSGTITGNVLASTVASGNIPLLVASTTQVPNLNSQFAGTVVSAAQSNITSVGTLTALTVSGQITSSIATGTAPMIVASTTKVSNLYVDRAALADSASTATNAATVTTAAQPNITSVGTLTGLSVSGTISGSITGSAATVTTAAQPNITSVGTLSGLTVTAAISGSVTGSAATVTTAAQPNITSLGTLTGLTVGASILPSANVTYNLGSTSARFVTAYAQATTALYADLAEKYVPDATYDEGTVVVFGGSQEVTVTITEADTRVAGVVSTKPAYLMNDGQKNGVAVALRGKVPVKVVGLVNKGDLLVTSKIPGYAQVGANSLGHAVFAKAIETKTTTGEGVVWAVIL
jgi:hypothetical protein